MDYKCFVENIILSLKFGDIIYAKRYNNYEEKCEMLKGHDKGPYIVIGFTNSKVIGVPLTSDGKENSTIRICENNNQFNRSKKSYMYINKTKTIDYKSFINKYNIQLNSCDLKKIKKIVFFNKLTYNDNGIKKVLTLNIYLDFEVGDIVTIKDTGYTGIVVNKLENSKYLLVPCGNYNKKTSYIDFSKVKIDYFNAKEIEKKSLYYLNSLNIEQLNTIKYNFYEYKKNNSFITNNDKNRLVKGCLVNMNNCLFYVYDVEGNIAHLFYVIHVAFKHPHITIDEKTYFPFYDSTKDIYIDRDLYKVVAVANEKEKKMIEENKNKYIETYKYEAGNKMLGAVICPKKNTIERFLVIEEKEETYLTILLSSLISGQNIECCYIPKSSVVQVNEITTTEQKIINDYMEQLVNKTNSKK